jgi:hypothetical protein
VEIGLVGAPAPGALGIEGDVRERVEVGEQDLTARVPAVGQIPVPEVEDAAGQVVGSPGPDEPVEEAVAISATVPRASRSSSGRT